MKFSSAKDILIGFGDPNVRKMTPKTVNTYIVHPDYNPLTGHNDIGIVILPTRDKFTFNATVDKIALPTASPTIGTVGELSGFGFTAPDGNAASDDMAIANLKVVHKDFCEIVFWRKLDKKFCAAPSDFKSNVCMGDHGSGLVTPPASGGTTLPADSTTGLPTTDGTHPTTDGTHPTTDATHPTTEETHPTTDATQPTTDGTPPTTDTPEGSSGPGDVLVGIASLISPRCNSEIVSGYTDVYEYIEWIQDIIS